MLKYIGDLDKLKDYGFYHTNQNVWVCDLNQVEDFSTDFDDYEEEICITVNWRDNQEDNYIYFITEFSGYTTDQFDVGNVSNIPSALFDLIKDGLVIKEEE